MIPATTTVYRHRWYISVPPSRDHEFAATDFMDRTTNRAYPFSLRGFVLAFLCPACPRGARSHRSSSLYLTRLICPLIGQSMSALCQTCILRVDGTSVAIVLTVKVIRAPYRRRLPGVGPDARPLCAISRHRTGEHIIDRDVMSRPVH